MQCLGNQNIAPTWLESEAAQLRAVEMFKADFLRRYPDGIVLTELEHLAATTIAPREQRGIQYPVRPGLNRVLQALATDYRRWITDLDYRKSDGMGLSGDGSLGELIEVTTVRRASAADIQLRDKLDTLERTVNRVHNLHVEWRRSRWRPAGDAEMFYLLPPRPDEWLRYLCYQPTERENAPQGVILYEIHAIKRTTPIPVPVPIPQDVRDRMRQASRNRELQPATADSWARAFAREHPILIVALRALALIGGVVLAIAAVIAIFDPLPGDEVAAGAAASALVRFALAGASAL
jgi:hypothetical protein